MELYSNLSTLAAIIGVFAFIFWLFSRLTSYLVERERKYMAMLEAVVKIAATLNPPLIACSSCKRSIPVTRAFRFDGVCPHCGYAHDPKSIAKAIKDS